MTDKHPWDDIKVLYVSGKKTLREISELPVYKDVPYGTILNRSSRDNWTKERLEYLDAEIKLAEAEKFKAAIKSKNEFDAMVFRATQVAVAHAAAQLTKHHNGEIHLRSKEIKENMSIVKDAVDITYRIWDIPAPMQRIKDIGTPAPSDGLPMSEIESIIDCKLATSALLVNYVSPFDTPGEPDNGHEDLGLPSDK